MGEQKRNDHAAARTTEAALVETKIMKTSVAIWLLLRVARWVCLIAFAVVIFRFLRDRPGHLTQFGHLLPATELLMFALPLGATLCGYLELAMREKAGLTRPEFGQLIPPKAAS
jgi:tellurite resistance protein TehA-like permease